MRRWLLALLLCLAPVAGGAITPGELLADPAEEARARAITRELRCVVCQSESIDESNAEIARDLRLLVRERIAAGDDDRAVLDYVVARYGEFVLFRPPFTRANAPLWFAGPAFLVLGAGLAGAYLRRHARADRQPRPALSAEERARLEALLRD